MGAAIVAVIAVAVIGIGSIFYMGSDNPIEESSENIIEEITGLEEIDLSFWEYKELDEESDGI